MRRVNPAPRTADATRDRMNGLAELTNRLVKSMNGLAESENGLAESENGLAESAILVRSQ
jgi:hypothetical protein